METADQLICEIFIRLYFKPNQYFKKKIVQIIENQHNV